jgi:hypothetical protein
MGAKILLVSLLILAVLVSSGCTNLQDDKTKTGLIEFTESNMPVYLRGYQRVSDVVSTLGLTDCPSHCVIRFIPAYKTIEHRIARHYGSASDCKIECNYSSDCELSPIFVFQITDLDVNLSKPYPYIGKYPKCEECELHGECGTFCEPEFYWDGIYGLACDVKINGKHEGLKTGVIIPNSCGLNHYYTVRIEPIDERKLLVRNPYDFDLCCYLYDLDAAREYGVYEPVSETACKNYKFSALYWKCEDYIPKNHHPTVPI